VFFGRSLQVAGAGAKQHGASSGLRSLPFFLVRTLLPPAPLEPRNQSIDIWMGSSTASIHLIAHTTCKCTVHFFSLILHSPRSQSFTAFSPLSTITPTIHDSELIGLGVNDVIPNASRSGDRLAVFFNPLSVYPPGDQPPSTNSPSRRVLTSCPCLV
jgi:hypothetical protein